MATAQVLHQADAVAATQPNQAVELYQSALATLDGTDDISVKQKEHAIMRLGKLYRDQQRGKDLAVLIDRSRVFLTSIPKAKTSKIVRQLLDLFGEIPDSSNLRIQICKDTIQWAEQEKQQFLKQSLEARLVALYLENKYYTEALDLISTLLRELKRLDDKLMLVEVHLLESRVCHGLRNLPKARAALTSAKTAANSIYVALPLQAALDLQSGILHAGERDYQTAYSYFFETFEVFSNQDDPRAVSALKYMLLCKIMLNAPEDVTSILHGKAALKYSGSDVEAMKAVATAYQNRSLREFEKALLTYKDELGSDAIIKSDLAALYDKLLEQNLLRIIEPFSTVEIAHIAALVNLPTQQVETKLSRMILDKTLNGILDQGAGLLLVYDDTQVDETYEDALSAIKKMSAVVDNLFQKAAKLS